MVYSLKADSNEISAIPLIADSSCPRCFSVIACPESASEIHLRPRLKKSVDDNRTTKVRDYGIEPDAFANPICGMLGPVVGRGYDSTTTAMATGYHRVRGRQRSPRNSGRNREAQRPDSKALRACYGSELLFSKGQGD